MDSLTAAAQRRNTPSLTFKKQTNLFCHMKNLNLCCFLLTECVCGSRGAGSGVLVGLRVAGGQRFSHGGGGAIRGVAGPAQGELQGGTLRETLKWRQTLQEERRANKREALLLLT